VRRSRRLRGAPGWGWQVFLRQYGFERACSYVLVNTRFICSWADQVAANNCHFLIGFRYGVVADIVCLEYSMTPCSRWRFVASIDVTARSSRGIGRIT
jgi:hypothetical protein